MGGSGVLVIVADCQRFSQPAVGIENCRIGTISVPCPLCRSRFGVSCGNGVLPSGPPWLASGNKKLLIRFRWIVDGVNRARQQTVMKRKRNDSQTETEPGAIELTAKVAKKRSNAKADSKPRSGTLKPGDAFVAICDWNGTVKWLSNHSIKTQVGDLGWINMIPGDAERFKEAFARTATLHERHIVEIASLDGLRYRIWMWSIGNPDLAVCSFNLMIPTEVDELTEREREFLEFLAQGLAIKEIACKLDVSINTVHAHMRNVKAKLSLSSPNEVVAFAARFFHQKADQAPVEATPKSPE